MSDVVIPAVVENGAELPSAAHSDDVGYDLRGMSDIALNPGERAAVQVGLRLAVPPGFAALIVSRSGLALDAGVVVLNSPGVIDPGYRGPIKVILANLGSQPVVLPAGTRLAQIVVVSAASVTFMRSDDLDPTDRGGGGLGSTGLA